MADDDIRVTLRAIGARVFKREVDKDARALDNLGDQAKQAARKMRALNAQTSKTRVSLGPFSTSARGGVLAVGALALATGKASTALIGFTEASATAVGGAGAAGGVGLTALGQGMLTVKLATNGLSDALGGNEAALAKLNPAQAKFVAQLQSMQPLLDTLRNSASGGLLGGAGKGLKSASKNFGVLNKIVKGTSGTLGGLAAKAGKGLGSKRAGADLAKMGATNVRIIDSLGNATLSLASAIGNVLVEAGPLAVWLADAAKKGAHLIDVWTGNARATGRLADFFKRAKTNLSQLGSILGHTGAGILNLFGAKDVDGTKTLASLDRISARFEKWSKSPAVQGGLGQAIIDQIPKAAAGIATALGNAMIPAGWTAAKIFVKSFWGAGAWGKVLIGGALATKLGIGKKALDALLGGGGKGGKGGVAAALAARGSSPANPLFVVDASTAGGKKWVKTAAGGGLAAAGATAATVSVAALYAAAIGKSSKGLPKDKRSNRASETINKAKAETSLKFKIAKWLGVLGDGGTVQRAGVGVVGERGPELLSMRQGTKVTPLPMGGLGVGDIHVPVYIDGRQVAEAVHRHDAREKARH